MVRWSGRHVIDCKPKTVQKEVEQDLIKNAPRVTTFTLKGDQLVFGTGESKFVYRRVK